MPHHCLERHGITPDQHHELQIYGVRKRLHEDFDPDQAEMVLLRVRADIQQLMSAPRETIHD